MNGKSKFKYKSCFVQISNFDVDIGIWKLAEIKVVLRKRNELMNCSCGGPRFLSLKLILDRLRGSFITKLLHMLKTFY